VKIQPRKVLDATGTGYTDLVSLAIIDAADSGAQIINLSLQILADSAILHNAVIYAANKGCVEVAAAGNYGDQGNPPSTRGLLRGVHRWSHRPLR